MATATLVELRKRPLWQIGLALLALHLTAFGAIFGFIRLLGVLGPLLSVIGASLAVAWVFLHVAKLPRNDGWIGS